MDTYSLNEIEAMGKRAARGAGLHWGYAEEAGKAARWLAQKNLPGPEMLVACLDEFDGVSYCDLAPSSIDDIWHNDLKKHCPLITGPILCDYASGFISNPIIEYRSISHPLLLAPYLAVVSTIIGKTINLSWEDVRIYVSQANCQIDGQCDALTIARVDLATCQVSEFSEFGIAKNQNGRVIDSEIWAQLSTFSYRTYAPATEASRLSGAGAGVSDND